MNLVAVINKRDEKFIVEQIVEFETIQYINEMTEIMGCDRLIVVNENVKIGNIYDPETENFIDSDNNIIFNSMNNTKHIEILERKLDMILQNVKTDNEENMSLSELKKEISLAELSRKEKYDYIINSIKKDCERVILAGFDAFYPMDADTMKSINANNIDTNKEMRHYSLSMNKQNDMKNLFLSSLKKSTDDGSEPTVLFRDDSIVMLEKYNRNDFLRLYKFLTDMISTCKIYSDGLEQYATTLYNNNDDEFAKVNWNTKLPNDILEIVCSQINAMADTGKARYYISRISKIDYNTGEIIFR